MSEHTPGPWSVDTEPGKRSTGGDCYAIITTPSGAAFDFMAAPSIDPAVHHANALLIAAAPDMKAALLAVLAEREKGARLNCWEQIEAAVAKAEGK
jgi:hypothetical protein